MLKKFFLTSFYCFILNLEAQASAVIVKDKGNTVLISNYITSNKSQAKSISKKEALQLPFNIFPLETSLVLGKVNKKTLSGVPNVNVALVGINDISHKWLINNIEIIKKYGAIVVIISAKNYIHYQKYKAHLVANYGLVVSYGKSDVFKKYTDKYPVLIADGELIQ
jgi:hypothetical protein